MDSCGRAGDTQGSGQTQLWRRCPKIPNNEWAHTSNPGNWRLRQDLCEFQRSLVMWRVPGHQDYTENPVKRKKTNASGKVSGAVPSCLEGSAAVLWVSERRGLQQF